MRSALALPGLAFGLAACSALPSRIAIAGAQSSGASRMFYLAGGWLSDIATVGPIFVVAAALLSFFSAPRAGRRIDPGLALLLGLFALGLFTQNATAQFRIERGVLPGPIDLRQGMGHHDFFTAEAPGLLAGRFLWANVACTALAIAIARRLRPALTSSESRLRHARGIAVAIVVCISAVIASRRADAYCGAMNNRDALASPSAALVNGLLTGDRYDGSPSATRRLLAEHVGTNADVEQGARNLGFPPECAVRLTHPGERASIPHPLTRPLDVAEDAEGRTEPELMSAARAVSRAFFRDRDTAPLVFHVSLESMRADDIHALDADAPAAIAPFASEVYSDAESAAAFAHAHQSGVRTSQALGAVMCGIGALPFHISASRDLGALPLRCMPDVLADAHFRTRAFYGHELVFDDMETFFRGHGMSLHERRDFPKSAPRGVWDGVSDAAVYDAAIDDAERGAPDAARYEFVLTLSHHAPYTAPADLSPPHRAEIDALCRTRDLHGEDCTRLATMRYADESLRRFVSRVSSSKVASRSIVVVAGDHTVHRSRPWGAVDRPDGTTRIPLFVWLPPALRASATDPAAIAAAWSRFRALATTQPVSNSDLPSLLLALLAETRPMRTLPAEARWHTLGGQATSPHYRSITGRGAVHGVDAHGFLFDVGDDGAVRRSGGRMESLRGPDDVTNAGPHNRPEIALLGAFLRGDTARK